MKEGFPLSTQQQQQQQNLKDNSWMAERKTYQ